MSAIVSKTISASDGKQIHRITMINRTELSCEGITEIVGYNEGEVILDTTAGRVMIGGDKLSISSLSVETGSVKVFGEIKFVEYKTSKQEGFIKRMLR